MANTYKNIVITPNISSNTDDPKIVFSGANTTVNTDITLRVYPDSNGVLSFEGTAGQLFSVTNDLSNNIFGVNDVSGIPFIEVFANNLVSIVPISGNVGIRNTSPSHTISVNGDLLVNTDIDVGNSTVNAVINSTAFLVGNITTGTSGLLTNTTRLFIGNNTINATVNTTTLYISGNVIANTTGVYTTGNITLLGNAKQLKFATVNTSTYSYFTQQNDDNFVFYTSNTAYGARAVWSIFANSISSNMNFSVPVHFSTNATAATNTFTLGSSSVGSTNQANGYSRMPNGLLMQWGFVTTANTTAQAFAYPVAFTNVFSITATANTSTATAVSVYPSTSGNITHYTLISASATSHGCFWSAIGK